MKDSFDFMKKISCHIYVYSWMGSKSIAGFLLCIKLTGTHLLLNTFIFATLEAFFSYGTKRIVLIQIASIYQKVNLNTLIIFIIHLFNDFFKQIIY